MSKPLENAMGRASRLEKVIALLAYIRTTKKKKSLLICRTTTGPERMAFKKKAKVLFRNLVQS